MVPDTMRCFLVRKVGKDQIEASVQRRPLFELPAGEVLIRVACSSVNYKDALASRGHPGVARKFPHVPGIDAAGTVVESVRGEFAAGDQVLVTSYELGVERWGGWAEYIRVPAHWVVPLPPGLSLTESMILGTAGLTAALCVRALIDHGVTPDSGEIGVTGATGGVGTMAIKLLAKLGYSVVAVTGKNDRHAWLSDLGAGRVVGRESIVDPSGKPLLAAEFAGAVDTVGGSILASLLPRMRPRGCVACCGVVGGAELSTTVYPFILRGITLAGIDSAWCPAPVRSEVWSKLATAWRLAGLDGIATRISLDDLAPTVDQMLQGQLVGRTLVDVPT